VEVVKVGIKYGLQKAMRHLERIKDKVIEHLRKLIIKTTVPGAVGIGTGIVFGFATGGPLGALVVGGSAALCTWYAGEAAEYLTKWMT